MIILDSVDECAPLKPSHLHGSQSQQTQSSEAAIISNTGPPTESPPPYSSSSPETDVAHDDYDAIESQTSSDEALSKTRRRRRGRARRIWRASILLLVLFWLSMTTISRTIRVLFGSRLSDHHGVTTALKIVPDKQHENHPLHPNSPTSILPINSPSGAIQSFCLTNASWSDTNRYSTESFPFFSADTSFQIPVSARSLSLISRGPLAAGKIQIINSPLVDDVVRVYVTMRYTNPSIRDRANVCLMERFPGNPGVGIFTSQADESNKDWLDFDVTVMFPPSLSDRMYGLETDLPMFAHGLAAELPFDTVDITTTGMPVVVSNINAKRVNIKTSDATIQGTFNVSEALSLSTSNRVITADISLINANKFPTRLEIQTSNSRIDTNINLVASTPSYMSGKYDISVTASNTTLNLLVPSQPIGASVRLHVDSSHMPTSITLPPQFEGRFRLTSKDGPAPPSIDHPRQSTGRKIETSERKDTDTGIAILEGEVTDEHRKEVQGHSFIDVITLNASAALYIR